MIELIDSHAHIYLSNFEDDLSQVFDRARQAGIVKVFMPNIDSNSIERMLILERDYGDLCVPMMGIHPCYVHNNYKSELEIAKSWLSKRDFCAIGEIGIDLFWDKTYIDEQIEAFETQINWAKELNKPIVIHCRESLDLSIEIVKKNQNGSLRGIFHCFTGSLDQAKKVTDLNFLIGIGGVATFKNGGLEDILKEIPLKHLVLETDSPYLAPVPFRGKRNEPGYLRLVAERVAKIRDCELIEISSVTTFNAQQLFGNGTINA
jgi:TatD DNase family protein